MCPLVCLATTNIRFIPFQPVLPRCHSRSSKDVIQRVPRSYELLLQHRVSSRPAFPLRHRGNRLRDLYANVVATLLQTQNSSRKEFPFSLLPLRQWNSNHWFGKEDRHRSNLIWFRHYKRFYWIKSLQCTSARPYLIEWHITCAKIKLHVYYARRA